MNPLALPLVFRSAYQVVVWGGRRMARWRDDLPEGPVGESWDLADHERGMSVVAEGALAGRTLRELTRDHGRDLIGAAWDGGDFPLMVKLIDANDRLSVQVHPDDALARRLGVGSRGKTECWLIIEDGGELFVGLQPGTTREAFAAARAAGTLVDCLQRHQVGDGDFAFLPARTVHALGAGCLLYEVQQTCDATFRVDDWGRVGLDGRPRPLHIEESLATIDFSGEVTGRVSHPPFTACRAGGEARELANCPYFTVEERAAEATSGGGHGGFTIVTCLDGTGTLSTAAGAVELRPMRTCLVPAAAGPWHADGCARGLRLLIAR